MSILSSYRECQAQGTDKAESHPASLKERKAKILEKVQEKRYIIKKKGERII